MKIKLEPINDTNREAVLTLTVREDQPFVAQNDYSLSEADEANAKAPGTARSFAIYAGEKIVGFFQKAGYDIAGELKDLPKGHSFFIVYKDL